MIWRKMSENLSSKLEQFFLVSRNSSVKGIIKTFASAFPDVFRVQSYCIEFTFHPTSQFVLKYNILAAFTFGIINGNTAH